MFDINVYSVINSIIGACILMILSDKSNSFE